MPEPFSTAIVVGASSGIGEAMVRKLAQGGTRVAAVARRQGELDRIAAAAGPNVRVYAHDVRDYDATPALFDRIVADLGGCDLFVYNAGVMPAVGESEYDFAKDREMIEINLLGAICWIDLAAAFFEAQRKGTLCGVSSVAGDRGRRGNPAYHTSKAGLTTFLESMRNRLSRHGVNVVTIKPGPVDTPMTKGLKLPLIISADACADGALALMRAGTGVGYVPAVWGPIMWVIRNIPSVFFRRTNI
jgi:NAD(P)-dependent dehydrogenase (short-subunit alcohol dehydrogenase family)